MTAATATRGGADHRVRSRRGRGVAPAASIGVVLGLLALVAGLGLVAWRQSRALEALAALEGVRQERALAVSRRAELQRRIQYLESRGHTVPQARDRLGMHTPSASEMVILPGVRP